MKWACASVCVKSTHKVTGGISIDYGVYTYLLEATSYEEAIGKAVLCLDVLKKDQPGYDHYSFHVNKLGEECLIRDPKDARFIRE